MSTTLIVVIATILLISIALGGAFGLFFTRSQPDQWYVRVRDGRMLDAGIGIARWRRPGDVAVRFTSTVQRVRFQVHVLTRDRFEIAVEGFILWSVAGEGDGPFRAYRKFGLTPWRQQSTTMRETKHLLTTPQHRAFRKLLEAQVQRYTSTLVLSETLGDQDDLVVGLGERLLPLEASMGIAIEQLEIVTVSVRDETVVADLAVEHLEQVRESAAKVRLQADERGRQREIESTTRLALDAAHAERDRAATQANAQLELEQRRAALLEAQQAVETQRQEHERSRQLMALENDRELRLRRQAIEDEHALAKERAASIIAAERRVREVADLEARLEAVRAQAEAERDAMMRRTEAEENKSDGLREQEMQRLALEQLTSALSHLGIKDARWVTVGNDSPLTSLTGLLTGLREAAQRH